MKEKNSIKDIDKEKGEFQHKMFKLIILFIAFIFLCLIGGFVYITITSTSAKRIINAKIIEEKFSTESSILQSNEKYYKIISNIDKDNYHLILNKAISEKCSKNDFYKTYIYHHIPCISENNMTNLGQKYFKFLSKKNYGKTNEEFFMEPKMDNIGRICINYSEEKIKILLAPISQIKYINLKNDINERKNGIYYEFILHSMNYIYIPSYYFIQIKEKLQNFICYEYQDLSFINDIVFNILYN